MGGYMRKLVLIVLLAVLCIAPVTATENKSNVILFNITFNLGTFSAGEYDNGSAFLGCSMSVDWIPDAKTGLSYGIESGLLGGRKQKSVILGIPAIFRIGWHPDFLKFSNFEMFVVGKLGWGFGIWGTELEDGSTPGGIVCGFNLGGRYALTPKLSAYAEAGYNYYGLARNSNYPEYPLGYGSGKTYVSAGLSFKGGKFSGS